MISYVIQNAKYYKDMDDVNDGIQATIDGISCSVPLDSSNSHYAEILKQVADGTLTIADAD